MPIYRFHGPDSSSDNGYWEALIDAPRADVARSRLRKHLIEDMNRPDLLENPDVTKDMDRVGANANGVLWSTVQTR